MFWWWFRTNLQESSLLREAIERVARVFCDLVVFLDSDFKVYTDGQKFREFFQEHADGRTFTDFMATSEDVERFTSMVAATCTADAPGLITVTLLQNHGLQKVEADIFISRTHKGVILGIAVSKEQFPSSEMTPQARYLCCPNLLDSESSNEASMSAWSTPTEKVFAEGRIDQILLLGESEHWVVPSGILSVNLQTILGQGGFSVVHSGLLAGVPVHRATASHEHLRCALNEIRIYRHVRHRNIALFHGASLVNGELAVVLENISGQCLGQFVDRDLRASWKASLILDLLSAVWYLHALQPSIVHGDLKPNNAMVEVLLPFEQGLTPHLKLIDFGLSRILGRKPESMGGTPKWIAPEVLEGHRAATHADMYSVGCIMFFILTRNTPVSQDQENFVSPLHWPAGETFAKAVPICEACVCLDAKARPNAADVLLQMRRAMVDEC